MKKLPIYLLAIFVLATGCVNKNETVVTKVPEIKKTDDLILNDTLEIEIGKTYHNDVKNISLKLDSVLDDSRCPKGVDCYWEGNAEVRFHLIKDDKIMAFTLNTAYSFQKDTILDGYKIKMLALNPYPVNKERLDYGNYKATIIITK